MTGGRAARTPREKPSAIYRDKHGVEYDVVALPSHELADAIAVDAMRAAHQPRHKPRVKEPLLSPKVGHPRRKRPSRLA